MLRLVHLPDVTCDSDINGNGAAEVRSQLDRMFNSNNNYLPDLNHFPPSGQATVAHQTPLMPDLTSNLPSPGLYSRYNGPGPFRFLSPTSGTAVPTWTPAMATSSTTTAPGVGTSWQHGVPVSGPWGNQMVPHFSGHSIITSSMPVYTNVVGRFTTTPQTTTVEMGPRSAVLHSKRRFHIEPTSEPDGPCAKRYLSEKMAEHFKQLNISEHSDGVSSVLEMAADAGLSSSPQSFPTSDFTYTVDNGWQRFREVEKRLASESIIDAEEMSMGIEVTRLGGQRSEDGMVLAMAEELQKGVGKPPSPVLPDSIIKSIANPCTELVLYKCPETVISNGFIPPTTEPEASMSVYQPIATSSQSQNSAAALAVASQSCPLPIVTFSAMLGRAASDADMLDLPEDDMDL